nr:hypothetical protein CFP56_50582 [Quercus suber]
MTLVNSTHRGGFRSDMVHVKDLLLQNKKRGEGAGGEREGEILYSSIALPQKIFATETFNNQGFFFTPNGNLALKQPKYN